MERIPLSDNARALVSSARRAVGYMSWLETGGPARLALPGLGGRGAGVPGMSRPIPPRTPPGGTRFGPQEIHDLSLPPTRGPGDLVITPGEMRIRQMTVDRSAGSSTLVVNPGETAGKTRIRELTDDRSAGPSTLVVTPGETAARVRFHDLTSTYHGGPPFQIGEHGFNRGSGEVVVAPGETMQDFWARRVDQGEHGELIDPLDAIPIYLSAGIHEGGSRSCNNAGQFNCQLFVVYWSPSTRQFHEPTRLFDDPGLFGEDGSEPPVGLTKPAVSPSGERLAFVKLTDDGSDFGNTTIWASEGGEVVEIVQRNNRPVYPNWLQEDEILFNWEAGEKAFRLGSVAVDEDLTLSVPSFVPAPGTEFGDAPLDVVSWYEDAHSHSGPAVASALGSSGPLVVAMRTNMDPDKDEDGVVNARVPSVFDLDGNAYGVFDPTIFAGGAEKRTLVGCHHPAWNLAGDRFLCSSQQEVDEEMSEVRGHTTGRYVDYRFLYQFQYSGEEGTWAQVEGESDHGSLFPPINPDDLEVHGRGFTRVTYKFAEWCGSDQYVIATVFGEDPGDNVVFSRVFIVDLATGLHYDASQTIQDKYFPGEEMHAAFSTCGPFT